MKKHLILLFLMLVVFSANAKKVKFAVDMTGQTVSPNGVHVAGDFQDEAGYEGGDWQSNTTVMTNETGTEIYSVIVDIPAFSKWEYKFLNGDQWYEVEFVPWESRVGYDFNDNRWVYVDSLYNDTTIIPAVLFSGNAPAGQYLLRFKVDLQLEELIDPSGVNVVGEFQDWDPYLTSLYSFTDKVYERIVFVDMASAIAEYRFVNGNINDGEYETVPIDCSVNENRYIIFSKDTVMETVCFSSCSACEPQSITGNYRPDPARIYPNPCTGFVNVDFNDDEDVHKVTILDIMGNTLRNYDDCRTENLRISCENLEKGVYFIKIESGNKWLSTLRLVISN